MSTAEEYYFLTIRTTELPTLYTTELPTLSPQSYPPFYHRATHPLTTELPTLWNNSATLDYLRGFDRQVQNDVFFEELVACTKEAMLSLQCKIKEAESRNKRNWTVELSRLKTGNYAANFERICHLETLLNVGAQTFRL
jgi:hypothetical protein